MAVNRGKQFEYAVRECFERLPDVSIDRLYDQTNGFAGSTNICDFIVYRKPFEYYIECKSVHGNTLSIYGLDPKKKYGNITNKQWEGMLEKSQIKGVIAGVICWWVDKDITKFIPMRDLVIARRCGYKSIRYDTVSYARKPDDIAYKAYSFELQGRKKRVFFDYDMEHFLKEASVWAE